MLETNGKFYLGRTKSATTGEVSQEPLLYDPADLTTHGVVVGMTGSGKTGLCLDLLEEAALNGVPALMIDPKGDITNSLLHFPDLAPVDFAPWINADIARRAGKTVEEVAEETAESWRKGLASWDIEPERIRRLKESVQFAIYTPGSDAGLPLSILASLAAPKLDWDEYRDLLREQIATTVIALLGLTGMKNIDPLQSREHILLANIFEYAWSRGQDLEMSELILQVQEPPFEKLGVFPVEQFFPEKARFSLAMQLNNILAAPSFQAWIEGEPLDIARLLHTDEGKPRHTIFYVAHLSESERMFFVTLLLSAAEAWMRAQRGSTSLRALIYFDEIFGYLPPIARPPSKLVLLRLLKQARAFGLGLLLATQNPADVDYKGLSNAGTWFVGKLATERDKERLLDGLSSGAPDALDRREYDRLISRLGKRVFLLRNIHEAEPVLFQTRWAMNYLAGPVTRTQIDELNILAGAIRPRATEVSLEESTEAGASVEAVETSAPGPPLAPTLVSTKPFAGERLADRPAVPTRIQEYFLPYGITPGQALARYRPELAADWRDIGRRYRPALLAQVRIGFFNRTYALDLTRRWTVLAPALGVEERLAWQDYAAGRIDPSRLAASPLPEASYAPLEGGLADGRVLRALRDDLVDWLYRNSQVIVRENKQLAIVGGPEVSLAEFRERCTEAARERSYLEEQKVAGRYDRRIEPLQERLAKAEAALTNEEAAHSERRAEEAKAHAKTVLSLFKKQNRSSSATRRRATQTAKERVEKANEKVADLGRQLAALETERDEALLNVRRRWADIAAAYEEVPVSPFKKDITTELYGIAWLPYHILQAGENYLELPAYQSRRAD